VKCTCFDLSTNNAKRGLTSLLTGRGAGASAAVRAERWPQLRRRKGLMLCLCKSSLAAGFCLPSPLGMAFTKRLMAAERSQQATGYAGGGDVPAASDHRGGRGGDSDGCLMALLSVGGPSRDVASRRRRRCHWKKGVVYAPHRLFTLLLVVD
jgi:hypothetical protein